MNSDAGASARAGVSARDSGSGGRTVDAGIDKLSYTVRVLGALVAPFDDQGDPWDGTAPPATAVEMRNLAASQSNYAACSEVVQAASLTWDLPEVYGDARLSGEAYPAAPITLEPAASAVPTLTPSWTDAGWKHVRLVDSLRVLISLYDADATTPDAISYIMLDSADLEEAARVNGPVALSVYDRTGGSCGVGKLGSRSAELCVTGRVLWLQLSVTPEDPSDSQYAPAALDGADTLRDSALENPEPKQSTLWIHGLEFFGGPPVLLPWGDTSYWDKDNAPLKGPNPFAVNYHARAYLSVSNVVVQYVLDRFCMAPNSCVLACHSAGCAQVGYALATFGSGGTRWMIDRVVGGGSAAGGSELASDFSGAGIAGFLGYDLEVMRMRELYDHDALGVQVDLAVGASGGLRSGVLPGEDDNTVAYHSAGGARMALAYCNSAGASCDAVLPMNQFDDQVLFSGHRVVYRDDAVTYDHSKIKMMVSQWVAHEFPAP